MIRKITFAFMLQKALHLWQAMVCWQQGTIRLYDFHFVVAIYALQIAIALIMIVGNIKNVYKQNLITFVQQHGPLNF